jgi:V-type H+-transporting ATPase subunit H
MVVATLRVSLHPATFNRPILTNQNLLTQAPTQNLPSLFVQKALPMVTSLQARKWSDEEIEDDLTYLSTELKGRLEGLTTFDEYMSELDSGKLVWSPTHESDDFWKENGAKLGSEDGGRGIK